MKKIAKSIVNDVARALERLASKHGDDVLWACVNRLGNQRRERNKLSRQIENSRTELAKLERKARR